MVLFRSIDSVIKKVTSSLKVSGSNEEIFIVNKNRREVVKMPLPWQSVEYYLVSFANFAECKNFIYRISDFATSKFLDLSIDYKISCDRHTAKQTILALHGDSPLDELENRIKIWIDSYIGENTYKYVSDIDACFSGIWQINQELKQKFKNEIGLNFESKISIVDISSFKSFALDFSGLSCSISDFSGNRNLNLTIDYLATCDSNSIRQAVLALSENLSPIDILNKKIAIWIKEFSENYNAQIIDYFDLEVDNLKLNLCERARQEFGLNFEIKIVSNFQKVNLVDLEQLKPYNTGSISLPIRIADYDQELDLQLEAILDVDVNNSERAFKNRGRELLILLTLKEEINKYFLQNVNLDKFFIKLQFSIRQDIEGILNCILVNKGRRVAYLSLTSKSIPEIESRLNLKQFIEIPNYQVECSLKELTEPVRVNNSIKLQLVDLRNYRNAIAKELISLDEYDQPNIELWVKEKLTEQINSIFLDEPFSNIISEFEPLISEHIENKRNKYYKKIFKALDSAVRVIGYSVTQLILEPELEVGEKLDTEDFL